MNRLFVVPAAALLALPLSAGAFAQDASRTPATPDSTSHPTAMSHGGAMAHDSMGHGTVSHRTMGHGAMAPATPDRMSAPDQPK